MKQYFIILNLVIGFCFASVGQELPLGARIDSEGSLSMSKKEDDSKMLDSLGYNVESVIKTWKLRYELIN